MKRVVFFLYLLLIVVTIGGCSGQESEILAIVENEINTPIVTATITSTPPPPPNTTTPTDTATPTPTLTRPWRPTKTPINTPPYYTPTSTPTRRPTVPPRPPSDGGDLAFVIGDNTKFYYTGYSIDADGNRHITEPSNLENTSFHILPEGSYVWVRTVSSDGNLYQVYSGDRETYGWICIDCVIFENELATIPTTTPTITSTPVLPAIIATNIEATITKPVPCETSSNGCRWTYTITFTETMGANIEFRDAKLVVTDRNGDQWVSQGCSSPCFQPINDIVVGSFESVTYTSWLQDTHNIENQPDWRGGAVSLTFKGISDQTHNPVQVTVSTSLSWPDE